MKKANSIMFYFIILSLTFLTFMFPATVANAETKDSYQSNRITGSPDELQGVRVTPSTETNGAPRVDLPDVKIEQAKDFVERKGFDVVSLIQTFAEPFTIAMFILGAFMSVIGIFGRTGNMMKGVLIMVVAVVVYAAVIAAPELMSFGNSWLQE